MRLSTVAPRDETHAAAVFRAAAGAGVTWFDTADVYSHDDDDLGHNERLIARALEGVSARPLIASKGGLTRPGGRWVPNGRATHLEHAARDSAARLPGVDLYLLHVPDPKVKLSTSARALQRLVDDGLVPRVGLCNVDVTRLVEASEHMEVSAVQVELGPHRDHAWLSGLVDACRAREIDVFAHRPLGGVDKVGRWRRHAAVTALAAEREVSPEVVVLTWLCDLGVIPVVGATTVEHARALGEALRCPWDDAAREAMDEAFDPHRVARVPLGARRPAEPEGEVVMLMGIQGAGKSTAVADYEARGYQRLNRDQRGGRLRGLLPALATGLANGERHWVLDNTYGHRADRARVREVAWAHGAAVRCVVMDTPLEQAQVNVCLRLLERYGHLPSPEELAAWNKTDAQAFGPNTQFRYLRDYEPPTDDEGFDALEHRPFVRAPMEGGRAWFVQGDLLLAPDGPALADAVRARTSGLVLGYAWSRGTDPESERAAMIEAWGSPLEVAQCPHGGGPPRCWCRPPLPGLLLWLCREHQLDPARCELVGRSAADRKLAETLGMTFWDSLELST